MYNHISLILLLNLYDFIMSYKTMEDNIDIDIDWIEKFEKEDIEYSCFYKEPLETISINFIYINKNREIEKIDRDTIYLNHGLLDKFFLNDIINKNKIKNKIEYKPINILKYSIDLEPDNIKDYLLSENNNISELEIINKITNIQFNDSISILQDLNCLYILFLEKYKSNIQNTNFFNMKVENENKNINNNDNSIKKVQFNITKRINNKLNSIKIKTKRNNKIYL